MDKNFAYLTHQKLGLIELVEVNNKIVEISFLKVDTPQKKVTLTPPLKKAIKQLNEYFAGERETFSLELEFVKGTKFQKSCWEALRKIPYGETISYQDEARSIDNIKAVRAVGGANGKNPISIVVP